MNTPKYIAAYICERPYVEVLGFFQRRGDRMVRHRRVINGIRTNIEESLVRQDSKGCFYFCSGKVHVELHNLRRTIIKEY